MVVFTSILLATSTLIAAGAAAPSTVPSTGVVHKIFAGSTVANNGLHFEPENVVAEPGDVVQFIFLPKNHTIVQSSFDKPCEPLEGGKGIFSGFNFATQQGEAPNTFQFTVQNRDTIWIYCSQPQNSHCQKGMSAVINQNFNSERTLAKYKQNSVNTQTKQPSVDPLASQGGILLPNDPL